MLGLHLGLAAGTPVLAQGGVASLPLTDAAASWWTLPNVQFVTPTRAVAGYTKADGRLYVTEFNPVTGTVLNTVTRGTRYTQDDHNSVTVSLNHLGKLLVTITGHHNPAEGQGQGFYEAFLSTTDRISGLPTVSQTMPTSVTSSNYQQIIQNGAFHALWTNDDANNSWKLFFSNDAGASFTGGAQMIAMGSAPGGGQNQLYSLIQPSSDPNIARIIFMPHPSNTSNGTTAMDIRLGSINLTTGATMGQSSGTPVTFGRNAFTGGGSALARSNYWPIYIPPSGKSIRVTDFWANGTVIAGAEHNADLSDARHVLIVWDGVTNINTTAAWSKIDIGPAGSPFGPAVPGGYMCDMRVARETDFSGVRVYRTWNDGAGNYKLDRITAATWAGLAAANNPTTMTLRTASGGQKLTRIFPAYGGTSQFPAMVNQGTYTDYNTWALDMLPAVPV